MLFPVLHKSLSEAATHAHLHTVHTHTKAGLMPVYGVSCGQLELCMIRGSLLLCFFSLFCPCRKRQHSFHAGSLWLSGLFTKLQVPGQPQVQRVFGQHQHRAQPCALSQLGAPDQQQQKRFNPQPVCLVMLRCPCPKTRPKPCSHNPPRPSTAP